MKRLSGAKIKACGYFRKVTLIFRDHRGRRADLLTMVDEIKLAREMEINELLIEAFERLGENYTARENCSWPSSPTANWRKPN
jgi:hypothetical protein